MADHNVIGKEAAAGQGREKAALQVIDCATGYRDFYPSTDRSAMSTRLALNDFIGNDTAEACYSDAAKEIKAAVKEIGLKDPTGTPHRPT